MQREGWSDPQMSFWSLHCYRCLIERCQHTLVQTSCLSWPLPTTNSTNNGHVSVRTGPESEGSWPFLMIQVLFTSQVGGCPLHGDHMAPGLKAHGSDVSTPQRDTIMWQQKGTSTIWGRWSLSYNRSVCTHKSNAHYWVTARISLYLFFVMASIRSSKWL